jgi:hypothetical protein
MRSLDSLGASEFSRCLPGCAHWIPSLLTRRRSLDSLAAHPDALAGFSWRRWILSLLTRMRSLDSLGACWILSAPPDSLAAHPDALIGFSRRLWILSASLDSLGASGFSRCSIRTRSLDSLGSFGFTHCPTRCTRWDRSFLTAHGRACRVVSLLTWSSSLDSRGTFGFSRCPPGCGRWILSVLTALAGSSRASRVSDTLAAFWEYLSLLLDSVFADASQIRSLDSVSAYQFCWILPLLTRTRRILSLFTTLAGFSWCRLIVSFLTTVTLHHALPEW